MPNELYKKIIKNGMKEKQVTSRVLFLKGRVPVCKDNKIEPFIFIL